jgi:hypothetical protein
MLNSHTVEKVIFLPAFYLYTTTILLLIFINRVTVPRLFRLFCVTEREKRPMHCFERFCFLITNNNQSIIFFCNYIALVVKSLTIVSSYLQFRLNINKNKNPYILSRTILLTMCLLSGVVQFAGGQKI